MTSPAPGVLRTVQHTRELERIISLPRRVWENAGSAQFADQVTAKLQRPHGTMQLRPIQAAALFDAWETGGLFGPIGVGQGKTLISLMVAFVMGASRPLLLTKAHLIEKTKREMRELAYHWPIPSIWIESYEKLGRVQHAGRLEAFQPDLIICDECHKVKNPKAAVTKRLARYMNAAPATKFVAISGTITRRSIHDYAHLLAWCLKPANVPIPNSYSELEDWGLVLDERTMSQGDATVEPGGLFLLCNADERADRHRDPQNIVRRAFQRRLTETPGVVSTSGDSLGCSLTISGIETDMSPAVDDAFQVLRGTWTTPDGWPISDPMSLWRHARELALGFYYKWDPRPPDDWLAARKEFSAMCRHILGNNKRNLDSELQVINAVDLGHYPEAVQSLAAWRDIKATFVPNTVPVWIDDSVINLAARWAMTSPGIVWTEHVAFAERLALVSGLTYYGRGGQDRLGQPIESHDPKASLIASVASSGEGRNLQAWARMLFTSCPTSGIQLEQNLGRSHRPGQKADDVTAEIVMTALEHVLAFEQARRDARYQQEITGQVQKLNYADIVFPSPDDLGYRDGARWIK